MIKFRKEAVLRALRNASSIEWMKEFQNAENLLSIQSLRIWNCPLRTACTDPNRTEDIPHHSNTGPLIYMSRKIGIGFISTFLQNEYRKYIVHVLSPNYEYKTGTYQYSYSMHRQVHENKKISLVTYIPC